ncbi:hypothetical protein ACF0H5_001852 [Mactra antiquata]
MSYNVQLEDIIRDTGGCGRFQWITAIIVHASTCITSWSMLAMTFNGQQPDFMCSKADIGNSSVNQSVFDNVCHVNQTDSCGGYIFNDDMNTVVNEWNLVCDSKWIVAMITTIQMAGDLVGCFISGHLGDMIGRKPTFFLSLIILILFNIIAFFSINWQMYAAIRFVIGMGRIMLSNGVFNRDLSDSCKNDNIPGLMYFLSAVVMITSSVICFTFPDTNNKILEDTFESLTKQMEPTSTLTNKIKSSTEHDTEMIHGDNDGNEKTNPT